MIESISKASAGASIEDIKDQLTAGAVALAWMELERAVIGTGGPDVVTAARNFMLVVELRDKYTREAALSEQTKAQPSQG